MKKILCYGDSNTFGYNPKDGSRFDENTRWTGVLKKNFIDKFEVLEAGLNNRTGFVDNPDGFNHSSMKHFPILLKEIQEVELLILAIGTNDLQFLFDVDFPEIESGLKKLISYAREKGIEKIVLIPPVVMGERVLTGSFSHQFDQSSIAKSQRTTLLYEKVAKDEKCELFDFNEFAKTSDYDGLHYDEENHKKIGEKLTNFIKIRIFT